MTYLSSSLERFNDNTVVDDSVVGTLIEVGHHHDENIDCILQKASKLPQTHLILLVFHNKSVAAHKNSLIHVFSHTKTHSFHSSLLHNHEVVCETHFQSESHKQVPSPPLMSFSRSNAGNTRRRFRLRNF